MISSMKGGNMGNYSSQLYGGERSGRNGEEAEGDGLSPVKMAGPLAGSQ